MWVKLVLAPVVKLRPSTAQHTQRSARVHHVSRNDSDKLYHSVPLCREPKTQSECVCVGEGDPRRREAKFFETKQSGKQKQSQWKAKYWAPCAWRPSVPLHSGSGGGDGGEVVA